MLLNKFDLICSKANNNKSIVTRLRQNIVQGLFSLFSLKPLWPLNPNFLAPSSAGGGSGGFAVSVAGCLSPFLLSPFLLFPCLVSFLLSLVLPIYSLLWSLSLFSGVAARWWGFWSGGEAWLGEWGWWLFHGFGFETSLRSGQICFQRWLIVAQWWCSVSPSFPPASDSGCWWKVPSFSVGGSSQRDFSSDPSFSHHQWEFAVSGVDFESQASSQTVVVILCWQLSL